MKLRFGLKAIFLCTVAFAFYSAWLASRTEAVSAEIAQIVVPLGADSALLDKDKFYSGLLERLAELPVDRIHASNNPTQSLRDVVRLEITQAKDATSVLVGIIDNVHRHNASECSQLLDAALAELKSQLPESSLYRTLNRRN